jgi:hypothetical protein
MPHRAHPRAHPLASYSARVQRWLVLEQPPSPTTDYYLRPRAAHCGLPVRYRSLAEPVQPGDLAPGTLVIVVRYLSRAWAQALQAQAAELAGVVYLMDDDLLDPRAWRGLPLGYQWRLWRHGWVLWPALRRLASAYWMSTPALVQRYAHLGAQLVPPLPLVSDGAQHLLRSSRSSHAWPEGAAAQAPEKLLLFYHGTRSHMAEMHWLRPIVAQALAACPQLHFEVMGEASINQIFRSLPRTRVLHPMSWPNYLAHCHALAAQAPGQRMGLAPLLPSRFNAVRSHTRAFDVARCAAVGLYAEPGPYAQVIGHERNGLLLPQEPAVWVQAIVALCADDARRQRLSAASTDLLGLNLA